jgi:CheY-like chemotaxis protein
MQKPASHTPPCDESPTPRPASTTVLIVDDEVDLLEIIQTALTDGGYRCLTATRAADALQLLSETPVIDVIVSDVRMPEMDGLSLLETIREQYQDRSWLQVLFLTGHASIETAIAALRLEAVDLLHKPVRQPELLEAVQRATVRAISQRHRLRAWQEGQSQLARLSEDVLRVTEMLTMIPTSSHGLSHNGSDTDDFGPSLPDTFYRPPSNRRLLELIRMRETRQHFFDDKLFADPVLQMLLDMMENRLLRRQVSVLNLCQSSGVPISTAIRRLDDLEQSGFIIRWDDPKDGRRQLVKLTPKALQKLTGYLHAIDRQLR